MLRRRQSCALAQIQLRDLRSLEVQHSSLAHLGGVAAVTCKGDLVASCGLRAGGSVFEPYIKVFDVRMSLRPLKSLVSARRCSL